MKLNNFQENGIPKRRKAYLSFFNYEEREECKKPEGEEEEEDRYAKNYPQEKSDDDDDDFMEMQMSEFPKVILKRLNWNDLHNLSTKQSEKIIANNSDLYTMSKYFYKNEDFSMAAETKKNVHEKNKIQNSKLLIANKTVYNNAPEPFQRGATQSQYSTESKSETSDCMTDSKVKLTDLVTSTNNIEPPYECMECVAKFDSSDELRMHMIRHTDDTNVCFICAYIASHLTDLNTHMMENHTTFGKRKCAFCGHTTSRGGKLLRHMMTHTGSKPFACSVCPYRAQRRDVYEAHVKNHEFKLQKLKTEKRKYRRRRMPESPPYSDSDLSMDLEGPSTFEPDGVHPNPTYDLQGLGVKHSPTLKNLNGPEMNWLTPKSELNGQTGGVTKYNVNGLVGIPKYGLHRNLYKASRTENDLYTPINNLHRPDIKNNHLKRNQFNATFQGDTSKGSLTTHTTTRYDILRSLVKQSNSNYNHRLNDKKASPMYNIQEDEVKTLTLRNDLQEKVKTLTLRNIQENEIKPLTLRNIQENEVKPLTVRNIKENEIKPVTLKNLQDQGVKRGTVKYEVQDITDDNEDETPLHTCHICQFRAIDSFDLKQHEMSHTGERIFLCPFCPYEGRRKSNLDSHLLVHKERHSSEDEEQECDLKREVLYLSPKKRLAPEKNNFNRPPMVRINTNGLPVQEFRSPMVQMQQTKLGSFTRQSPVYNHSEKRQISPKKERRKGNSIDPLHRPVICPKCPSPFRHLCSLKRHYLKMHTSKCPTACTLCPYIGRSAIRLRNHLYVHSLGGYFNCSLCHYKTLVKSKLASHMITHEKEKKVKQELMLKGEVVSLRQLFPKGHHEGIRLEEEDPSTRSKHESDVTTFSAKVKQEVPIKLEIKEEVIEDSSSVPFNAEDPCPEEWMEELL